MKKDNSELRNSDIKTNRELGVDDEMNTDVNKKGRRKDKDTEYENKDNFNER
jgi:hypothetical protein